MPAVAALPAIAFALLALLLIYGSSVLAKWIAHALPQKITTPPGLPDIPFGSLLQGALDAIGNLVVGLLAAYVRPVIGFFARPVVAALGWIDQVASFVITAASTLDWIVTQAVPQALSAAKAYAATLYLDAKAWATDLYHRSVSYTAAKVAAVTATAVSLYHSAQRYAYDLAYQARVYARDLVHAEEATRAAADAAVKSYAAAAVAGVRADLGNAVSLLDGEIKAITSVSLPDVQRAIAVGVTTAETYASAAVVQGIADLTTDVEDAISGVFDGLIIDVGALSDVIGTDLPDLGALVRDIPTTVPLSIAGTSALSLALSRVAIRYMEQCGVPNCRNLSKYGRDLQDLFTMVEGAGLIGLLIYMISNPEGAAAEARDVLGPIAEGLGNTARDLLGV